MSQQLLFIDDGDGTTLEVLPQGDAGVVQFVVREFAAPGSEAVFDLSDEDADAFLEAFRKARESAS